MDDHMSRLQDMLRCEQSKVSNAAVLLQQSSPSTYYLSKHFFFLGYLFAAAVQPAGGRAETPRAAHQPAEGEAGRQI